MDKPAGRIVPALLLPIIALIFSAAFCESAAAQEAKRICDGRLSPKPGIILPSEQALIRDKAIPAARAWQKQTDSICTGGDEAAIDAAVGSFTRPASFQRAILYRFCTIGHNRAVNGIAVIENGQLAANVVYEGGWDNAIGAVTDLNGSGRSEIIVACGGTNQGTTWKSMAIIELGNDGVAKFGRARIYTDDCGAGKACQAEAGRLSARPGKPAVFYREDFIRKGADGKWGKPGPSRQISLEKDEVEYFLVK